MASASLFLDTRRPLSNGLYKVRIRVTSNRNSKYFSLPYSYDKNTFKKIVEGKYLTTTEHKQAHSNIISSLKKAQNIIAELSPFNFPLFTLRFSSKGDRNDIIDLLTKKADEFKADNKFSSSNLYLQAATLFKKYVEKKYKSSVLKVGDLTPKELQEFENWAKQTHSLTTIGMYMTRTRAILNSLIRSGEFNRNSYPFGKKDYGLYQIPRAKNAKRPLKIEEIMAIYNYSPKTLTQTFAKDIFIFSYLASGMNLYDIFKLKYSDFDEDIFTFIRKKTEHKRPDKIVVKLNEDLNSIIDKHGTTPRLASNYVFNVLRLGMSPLEENKAVRSAVSTINQSLKLIAKSLGITDTISSYYARHSFSNVMMQGEVPLAYISKKLGHSDLATTQSYLDQFTKDSEEKYTAKLLRKDIV